MAGWPGHSRHLAGSEAGDEHQVILRDVNRAHGLELLLVGDVPSHDVLPSRLAGGRDEPIRSWPVFRGCTLNATESSVVECALFK